jgi:outer membrane protein assembly factor BamB
VKHAPPALAAVVAALLLAPTTRAVERDPATSAIEARGDPASLAPIRSELFLGSGPLPVPPVLTPQVFPDRYAEVEGITTFRGGPLRDGGAFGDRRIARRTLEVAWTFKTDRGTAKWGGGAGWTGQPVIVRWAEHVRRSMPLLDPRAAAKPLVEVIQGSLDGNVWFIDLETGRATRPPLRTGNPNTGSVSLDPRGWPLLFVGQGIPGRRPIGLRAYSLITHGELLFLPGREGGAPRDWGAFDGSGLVNRATDTFLVGGENGIVYAVELNTDYDPLAFRLALSPRVLKYRFRDVAQDRRGIENSLAVFRNLAFFADNGGTIQALDLNTLRPAWAVEAGDDTDASLVVDLEPGGPVLYTACEVDAQGLRGETRIRKIDAITGRVRWERSYACRGERVGEKTVQAGVFATPLVGSADLADRIVVTLSRCPERGAMVALAKSDGRELWRRALRTDAWSTPTAVRDAAAGKTWILQGDRAGRLHLVDGADGTLARTLQLDANVEASPAVFGDLAVVGTRGGTIYGIRIR